MDNFLYLSRIYDAIDPEFNESFPYTINESDYESTLIDGFNKVVRGLRLLNTLYSFEKDGLVNFVETNKTSDHDNLNSLEAETELTPEERLLRAMFGKTTREVRETSQNITDGENGKENSSERRPSIIDSRFAITLSNNARTISQCFQEFTPDQKCDLFPLFRELVYFMDNYLDSHSYPGHIDVMIQRAITSLAIADLEMEAQTSAMAILEFQDPPSWNFGPVYEDVLKALTSHDLQGKEKNPVSVKRYFVGYLACIVASDEEAELISKSEFDIPENEWGDSYKYGQIYKNDKRAPDSRDEWFNILSPQSEALYLGERIYKDFDEALKYEKIWMDLTFDVLM